MVPSYSNPEFRRRSRSRQKKLRVFAFLSTLTLIGVVLSIILMVGTFAYFAKDLPNPDQLIDRESEELSTKIYDRNGELLFDVFSNQNRTLVTIDQIPNDLKNATIAIEDKDFYKHKGFDTLTIIRIPYRLLFKRQVVGGSTMTQQLVKKTLLTSERTITRKAKEFFLAIQVENKFEKDKILQMYLNEVPYGGTALGVEAAAQQYFGKHAKDLNLAESAILAGLPQRPTYYSPLGNYPDAYKGRAQDVLRRMREDGYIDKEKEKQTMEQIQSGQIKFVPTDITIKAPHFVMKVKQELEEEYGEKLVQEGGLRVTTTLDYKMYQIAQTAVKEEIAKLKNFKVGNGAAVIMDPKTGDVLAMVGGKDYFGKSEPEGCAEGDSCVFEPNVNASLSDRQPGSATKPIAYAAAFRKGYSPASIVMDVPTVFPGGEGLPDYKPDNYDLKFHGPTLIRFALGNSYNIPAVKMLGLVGISEVMKQAYEMGITNWEPTSDAVKNVGLSLVLGGRELSLIDLVTAYSVFANNGVKHDPTYILKVTDAKGEKTYFEEKHKSSKTVLPGEVAFLISHILADNEARTAAFGANSGLKIANRTVAVKTGTTDKKKDNWTVGYTPSYTVGVWVGNNNGAVMDPKIASGVTGATPIWNRIMREILKDKPAEDFSKVPDKVVALRVDSLTGGLPKEGEPERSEYFIKGTEPKSVSPFYQRFNVCKDKNTNFGEDKDVEDGKTEPKDLVAFLEEDPISGDGKNRWQDGINAWAFGQPNEKLKAPYIKGCAATSKKNLTVQITNVPNGANVTKNFDIQIGANSESFTVVKITVLLDGKIIEEMTSQPYTAKVNLPDSGEHKVRVEAVDSGGNSDSQEITVKGTL